MTSRERMLTALDNKRPDRLPCQVHGWMHYYLQNFAHTFDWMEANEKYGFDHAIYVSPIYEFAEKDLKNWRFSRKELGKLDDGYNHYIDTIETPDGNLSAHLANNEFTGWDVSHWIKNWDDFKIWLKWRPIPIKSDFTAIQKAKDKLKDGGIIRVHPFSAGQGSPWQSLCMMMGTENAIMETFDNPDMVHNALKYILDGTLKVAEQWKNIPADMVETGGGAGSNTVISPDLYREFGLKYDQQQCKAFQSVGLKVVYHLCGGLMKMLDLVTQNGANGLETMTPQSMGGDCDLKKASAQVGDKLFFIGGFDQNAGFERGTPKRAKELVYECFEATKDHSGYIIAPSDHFFVGNEENLKAFCDAVKECVY